MGLGSMLVKKYGCQIPATVGGAIAGAAILASSFLNELGGFILFYGILGGKLH